MGDKYNAVGEDGGDALRRTQQNIHLREEATVRPETIKFTISGTSGVVAARMSGPTRRAR
jgi:hypothetical protein